ncbi:MAG: universal stress protein [Rhodospirillales bacterium]|jgi:nucleotide-binding universal stress UspA family protein|nr:universal stress protein [Rhodospirillales bacterium]
MPKQAKTLTTLRRILVPLDSKVAARSSMEAAFQVAECMAAHVNVLVIGEDPTLDEDKYPPNIEDLPPPTGVNRVRRHRKIVESRSVEIRKVFDDLCARHGVKTVSGRVPLKKVSAGWSVDLGQTGDVVARHGRRSDLIVLAKPTSVSKMRSKIHISAALFETGRPVLVAPPTVSHLMARKIAIAWNDSAEASRALAAAMRIVNCADKVIILTAESDRTPAYVAEELVEYFTLHGIAAECDVFAQIVEKPLDGRALLDECRRVGADLLVMGAHRAHSLRKAMVGTTTEQVLESATIPVLMAH